jgi:hypothetical protein
MHDTSTKIMALINEVKLMLLEIPEGLARQKIDMENWSRQEILGHLIDSAYNNHQRLVRGANNQAIAFPPYDQNKWVENQHYNEKNWEELVNLWHLSNAHFCWVIDCLPENALQNLCNIGKETPVSIEFVITDYLRHLRLHLEQLLGPLP